MINPDFIKYSLNNITKRKMRSLLTVLSILIGITAIYAIVSFGQGLNMYIDSFADQMGRDKIIIQARSIGAPGTDDTFQITQSDLDFVRKVKGVEEATGAYMKTGEVEFNDQKKFVFVSGTTTGEEQELVNEVFTLEIIKGRNIKGNDKLKVVLGYNYMLNNRIFSKAMKLGDKLDITYENITYKADVIGFFEEVGNPQDDSNVYLSQDGMRQIFNVDEVYQFIMLRSSPGYDPTALAEKIQDRLRKHKDQDKGEEDFFVQTFDQAIESFTNVIDILNIILVIIALISSVVAAINITNTMYTAVLERTREIGVMKAIGAKRRDILTIFLIESGFLGALGGVVGVALGYAISKTGGIMISQAGYSMLSPAFPAWLTIGCILFSFIVGAGAGLLPSIHAAREKPVDALRYE